MTIFLGSGILLVFLGLFILIVGFVNRQRNWGPLVIWIGVMTMIGVFVFRVLAKLHML